MNVREQLAELGSAAPARLRNRVRSELFRAWSNRGADNVPIQGAVLRSPCGVWQRLLKRTLDLCVALPLLALLALPMALVALLIRLDSKGPVIFRQRRLGLAGRPFDIFKFRTMCVLENGDDVVQARKNDPRITPLGRWLRRMSLDELPQLFNVVRGEMSLVGPRPHAVVHDRHFAALIDGYELRQRAKPGMTGWAQIHGLRGATPTLEAMRVRVLFDNWYTQHAGFGLDLRILLRTPYELLRQRNSY